MPGVAARSVISASRMAWREPELAEEGFLAAGDRCL